MTIEQAYNRIDAIIAKHEIDDVYVTITNSKDYDALRMARKALEEKPCEDAVDRLDALAIISTIKSNHIEHNVPINYGTILDIDIALQKLPSVTPQSKIGHCKDCKWWKDSDGIYRRDIDAESQCPMNCKEVFEGTGYCYMFKPQESGDGNESI